MVKYMSNNKIKAKHIFLVIFFPEMDQAPLGNLKDSQL